jgi:hypothetical protein
MDQGEVQTKESYRHSFEGLGKRLSQAFKKRIATLTCSEVQVDPLEDMKQLVNTL